MGQRLVIQQEQPECCVNPIELHRIRRLLNETPLTLQDFEVEQRAIGGKNFASLGGSTRHGVNSVVFPAVCRRDGLQEVQLILKILLDPTKPNLTIGQCGDPSHDVRKLPLHENVCSILTHFTAPLNDFQAVNKKLIEFGTRADFGRQVLVLVLPQLGRDLRKKLIKMKEDRAQTDPAFITTLCRDLIAGAHHLNSHGFIHRDIKADNILVVRSGGKDRFVITDLGEVFNGNGSLGMRFQWDRQMIMMRKAGAPYYHAPEVARVRQNGEIMDWSRQDCWGVGWVLYRAITGNDEPFGGKYGSKIKSDDDFKDFQLPDELNHVKFIVRELLRVDPEKRLTFEEALKELNLRGEARHVRAAKECGNIFKAAKTGNLLAVRYFVQEQGSINKKDEDGETALHRAADKGHKEVAELLLQKGADVHAKMNACGLGLGMFMLQRAAMDGSFLGSTRYIEIIVF